MRKKHQKQLPLMIAPKDHPQSKELKYISKIIDKNPTMSELILQDLTKGKKSGCRKGANGMSADQVLRVAIIKTLFGFTYDDLAFHTADSKTIRWFCRIGFADNGFQRSTLNYNIKQLSEDPSPLLQRQRYTVFFNFTGKGIFIGKTFRAEGNRFNS